MFVELVAENNRIIDSANGLFNTWLMLIRFIYYSLFFSYFYIYLDECNIFWDHVELTNPWL